MKDPVQPEKMVLASTSSRRSSLLRESGYRFEVVGPAILEPTAVQGHVDPVFHAESLAYFKASSVAGLCRDTTVLAADTIAVIDGDIIGKPADRDDARRILQRLSNTTHRVVTGVALLAPAEHRRLLQHDVSVLRLRQLADSEIEEYLDTDAWVGKAGAYGVQDHGDKFVEEIEGSFSNVIGLPMELLGRMFARWQRE